MDHDRFDALTRTLATGASRRTVLKTLAALATGGGLAMVRPRHVAAGRPCFGSSECREDQVCISTARGRTGAQCQTCEALYERTCHQGQSRTLSGTETLKPYVQARCSTACCRSCGVPRT